jgi:hypothetical protein
MWGNISRIVAFVFAGCLVSFSAFAQSTAPWPVNPTEADEIAVARLRWRDTRFVFDNYISRNTLDKSAQLTYNPTYIQSYSLQPRWYFTEAFFLRLRQDLILELTEPDRYGLYSSDSTDHRLFFLNTRVELVHTDLYEIGGVHLGAAGRLVLPISLASRASQQILGAGVSTELTKSFPRVLRGLALSAQGLYVHDFGLSNVVSTESDISCRPALTTWNEAASTSPFCLGGLSVTSEEVTAGLSAELKLTTSLTLSTGFSWVWLRGSNLADAEIKTLTGAVTLKDGSHTHWRYLTDFHFALGYLLRDWLEIATGIYTASPRWGLDGSPRNPFFNIDTQLTLKATILLDRLYVHLT